MPADPNDLTTLTTALAWLGCQQDDAFGTLQRVITAVSTVIQNLIGRNIKSQSYTDVFDGRGRYKIMMPNSPITAVTSVTIGEMTTLAVPPRSSAAPGFTFSEKFVYIDSPYRFDRGRQNVRIAYTAGFATIPQDIEQGCLIWIKTIMDGANYSAALQKAKAGQTSLDFSFAITKLKNLTAIVPPAVYSMIAPYQRVAPAW